MKIIFWGTPKYAADSLNSIINVGHEIIAVVTQPDRKRGRGKTLTPSPVKELAVKRNIPVYTTNSIKKDFDTKNQIINLEADIYIVVAFGQILPKEILINPRYGCWNSHASLLPLWRGAAPIQWSLIEGNKFTGVCIMYMEEGLDTGPVISQESIKINDRDNLETLTEKLSKISSKLLIKSIEVIKSTEGSGIDEKLNELNAKDQLNFGNIISYARQINKDDYRINWYNNPTKIYNLIRGLYPNAYTTHNGKRIKITDIDILDRVMFDKVNVSNSNIRDKVYSNKDPGTILYIDKKLGIVVATEGDPISIKSGQYEGKRLTDALTLSIQSRLLLNDILL